MVILIGVIITVLYVLFSIKEIKGRTVEENRFRRTIGILSGTIPIIIAFVILILKIEHPILTLIVLSTIIKVILNAILNIVVANKFRYDESIKLDIKQNKVENKKRDLEIREEERSLREREKEFKKEGIKQAVGLDKKKDESCEKPPEDALEKLRTAVNK